MRRIDEFMTKIAAKNNAKWKMRYINIVYRAGKSKYTVGRGDDSFGEIDILQYVRRYAIAADYRYDKMQYLDKYNYADYHKIANKLDMAATYE